MVDDRQDGKAENPLRLDKVIASNENEPVFAETVPVPGTTFDVDASLDFTGGAGDEVLDLADILAGTPGADNIDNYLLAIKQGGFSTLLVDTGGTGNFANPDLVFEISGVEWDSSVAGQIATLVDDAIILVV